jgi:dCMP deaminase
MLCDKHRCQLINKDYTIGGLTVFGGFPYCPICTMEESKIINRDKLGMPAEYCVVDGTGQLVNCIQGVMTPIKIGDQYQHREFGTGMVTWINPNNTAKHPIKMHFSESHCYCYFNVQGKQYDEQEVPLICFPRIYTKDELQQSVSDAITGIGACTSEATDIGNAFKLNMSGESYGKWDMRFIKLAEHIAGWSKDPSTKVGAVIIDHNNRIVSLGFNGFAKGVKDESLENRNLKYAKMLHSECNAILFANRDLSGCTIYVWPLPPCSQCMSMIIQSGISRVVTVKPEGALGKRWEESNKISLRIGEEANVQIDYLS